MSTIADLKNNTTISGIRDISATSNDSGLLGIRFKVDGTELYFDDVPPYIYSFYSQDYDNGEHVIRVESVRSSGGPTGTNYTLNFNNNFEYTIIGALILSIVIFTWLKNILLGKKGNRKNE